VRGYPIADRPRETSRPAAERSRKGLTNKPLECTEVAPDETEFQVLLFWKDDVRSEQREIGVTTVKQNGQWLVDDVSAARTQ